MRKKHVLTLKHWPQTTSKTERKKIICSDKEFIIFLAECVHNTLSGIVPVQQKELEKFETLLRELSAKSIINKRRSDLFCSTQGLRLIQLIALPCAAYLLENAY